MCEKNFDFSGLSDLELESSIRKNDHLYWDLGQPEIPDVEYHALTRELARRHPEHPLLTAIHTPRLETSEGKVTHRVPLLSLDKAYSLDEVLAWAGKYVRDDSELLLIQPKYDGISAIFDGRILATRGDGMTGDDISSKTGKITLNAPGYCGALDRPARGEIVIRHSDFVRFQRESSRLLAREYKNYRNIIAGILGQKNDDKKALVIDHLFEKCSIKLTLADYSLISYPVEYSRLRELWPELVDRITALDFPIDGIVVKLADALYADSLGSTEHHPRGAIAYKFLNKSVETDLLGVEWSFGKNCLTPVALLRPVDLNGITIKRATLHNVQNILDKDIEIGDRVVVERAGDVIPYIRESVPGENRKSALIEHCPGCGAELVRRGPELCCPNRECLETRLQQLAGAVKSLKIEYLGIPTLRKMIETFGIRHLKDIFELTPAQLRELPGFQRKSAGNLHEQIQSARVIADYALLAALNIPGIGPNIAKLIFRKYSFAELRGLNKDALSAIAGIGPERAGTLVRLLAEQSDSLDELLGAVRVVPSAKGDGEEIPKICFTGEMPLKRGFYENLARANHFDPVGNVSSSLAVLVAADPDGKSSKLLAARKFGVEIISLAEFLCRVDAPAPETAAEEYIQPDLF